MGPALRRARRPCAAFTADFPDDAVENEDGTDVVELGGRNVAEAIGQILRDLGCEVSETSRGDYGWELSARGHGRECFCRIISLHPTFFLLFEDRRARGAPIGHGLSQAFSDAMRRDGRFHGLLWYPREAGPTDEPDGSGTESPFADDPTGREDDLRAQESAWFWGFIAAGLLVFAALGVLVETARLGWLPDPLRSQILEVDRYKSR